jgi:DMSO/TMAO reductase YedYZ molybdopterin-dependent catalytic subunit
MNRSSSIDRRGFLQRASALTGTLLVGGCDQLSESPSFKDVLSRAEPVTKGAQRLILSGKPLAPEYSEHELSKVFKANGSTDVDDPAYQKLASENFANWRLKVDGLVQSPAEISLAELRAMPARTQITRHDCVEGWSAIGKWKGVPLSALLGQARLKPEARYLVFHCADTLEPNAPYYESIDLIDAFHPQTILAYEMNDQPLAIPHGAPLRLRVERQLGYKHAKYVMRIEAVESFASLGGGKGGFWEDRGYEWYAGI